MNAALWISKTGLSAQDAEMSAIANNIANVNTTGFKRDRVMFQDLFYQTQEAPGAMLDQNNIMPTGLQFGSGVRIVGTQKTFTEGNVETTDNAMNVAIMGQGFLQVQKANGDIAYIIITMQSIDGSIALIGLKVAAALVGTFLGVFICYCLMDPLANAMEQQARAEHSLLECIRTVLVAQAGGKPTLLAVDAGRKLLHLASKPTFANLDAWVNAMLEQE